MPVSTKHRPITGHSATDRSMSSLGGLGASVLVGYLAGTLPSSRLAIELAGRDDLDPMLDGTGNPGGMNTSHLLGKKWGAAVTAVDVAKAVVASRVGRRLAGDVGANLAATAAVIGHCHPPNRKGGKGIAASLGQVIATFPVYLPIDMAVAVSTAAVPWFRQRTRIAAGVASASWVGCALLWWRRGLPNPGGVSTAIALPAAALVSSLVIAERFRAEAASVAVFNLSGKPAPDQEPQQ